MQTEVQVPAMSPYTAIPEVEWRHWLKHERPQAVEFNNQSRIIQRASADSRDGRTARTFKSNGAEPGTRGIEQSTRECRNAARVQ